MSKCIGILGGFSPESTARYYKHIVRGHRQRHRDHAYPEIAIYSVCAERYIECIEIGEWARVADGLLDGLCHLKRAGADFAVIASNMMDLVFERVRSSAPLPVISMMDTTLEAIEQAGCGKVGLLASRFTLEKSAYVDDVERRGIQTVIPDQIDREELQRIISEELSIGLVSAVSRERCLGVIEKLVRRGSQATVLACAELPLLIRPADTNRPLFDSTILHANKALTMATEQ